jgi:hypothetical protein
MTPKQLEAAALVAGGKHTIPQIAEQVGRTSRTIDAWKALDDFRAKVLELRNAWRGKANKEGISDLDWTLRHLKDRHHRLRAVIEARAKDPQMQLAPGGRTGLLTVTYKMRSKGEGEGSESVPEYAVDTGLLQAMSEIEVQVQTHLGTWQKDVDKAGDINVNIMIERINRGRARVAAAKVARDAQALVVPAIPAPKP